MDRPGAEAERGSFAHLRTMVASGSCPRRADRISIRRETSWRSGGPGTSGRSRLGGSGGRRRVARLPWRRRCEGVGSEPSHHVTHRIAAPPLQDRYPLIRASADPGIPRPVRVEALDPDTVSHDGGDRRHRCSVRVLHDPPFRQSPLRKRSLGLEGAVRVLPLLQRRAIPWRGRWAWTGRAQVNQYPAL